ncbi:LysM peptidoglycan-binding domain-containing protein [Arthrobacter cheniae]|uniref:LysM peptidoglycan-binding domain-containing protein n=1 Tax=Arthrobacter cheniae TaxID=1258888 RepID=A0A3A5MCJ9_9MICC|nr:LysM peptidoglycan-binding domain-containing protein [Arthrobacter cheniae]RJT80749.1 LysM peptidoglycan-binding domain-containing protein [Arthrobacter cheniae]
MAEAPVLHGSTALWALKPARPETGAGLRLVPALGLPAGTPVPAGRRSGEYDGDAERAVAFRSDAGAERTSRQRTAERPVTLTQRGRLLLVGLPIAVGVVALIIFGAFLTSQAQAGEAAPVSSSIVEVNVAAGESLWDLAVHYAPERDPREVVAEMVELNDLRSSLVQAGQSISIPSRG